MAKASARHIYQAMEKVIITREHPARVAYVVESRNNGSTGIYGKGTWQVRIAYDLEDAREHRYKLISYNYIQPYREELWEAFARLELKRAELDDYFKELQNGKIPKALQPVVQGFLFATENARPIGRE